MDARGNKQPVGGVGELWISGIQVGRGYLNREEESAKAFISNPFAADEPAGYARVYRPVVIVRCLLHGCIDSLGRKDCQVNIFGFSI